MQRRDIPQHGARYIISNICIKAPKKQSQYTFQAQKEYARRRKISTHEIGKISVASPLHTLMTRNGKIISSVAHLFLHKIIFFSFGKSVTEKRRLAKTKNKKATLRRRVKGLFPTLKNTFNCSAAT